MILVAYRHGLRASELCELTWDAIDFRAAMMHVSRKKNGQSTTHQISGLELRALRKLKGRTRSRPSSSSTSAATVRSGRLQLAGQAGRQESWAPIPGPCPHDPHARGYKLAGAAKDTRSIQEYLGHKDIRHTVRYTELSPTRFKDFWRS
jgi:integrase